MHSQAYARPAISRTLEFVGSLLCAYTRGSDGRRNNIALRSPTGMRAVVCTRTRVRAQPFHAHLNLLALCSVHTPETAMVAGIILLSPSPFDAVLVLDAVLALEPHEGNVSEAQVTAPV